MEINDVSTKRCSYCGEDISAHTRRCPYCGSLLSQEAERENTDVQVTSEDINSELYTSVEQHNDVKERNVGQQSTAEKPLSNGMKVFLTAITIILPGIGQLGGIIAAIVFMNCDWDADRRSFGVALLVVSLIFFVITCLGCFALIAGISALQVYE